MKVRGRKVGMYHCINLLRLMKIIRLNLTNIGKAEVGTFRSSWSLEAYCLFYREMSFKKSHIPYTRHHNPIFLYIAKGKKVKKYKYIKKNKKVNKHTPFNKHVATGKKPQN